MAERSNDLFIRSMPRFVVLAICVSLLRNCKPTLNDPGVQSLLANFIGPSFQKDDSDLRNLSLECLALYVVLDKRICKEYFAVF